MDLTPYSSVKPLMGPLDQWLTAEDAERIQAYAVYEGIYRNTPQVFKLVQRGDEQNPIYLPSARTIIEAKNRYLAKGWNYALVPGMGSDEERAALGFALETLFRREIIRTKFSTQKRWGLVRGDSVWQIIADEEKDPMSRISVYEVDPASFFPIYDPWNPDKITGVHLVDPVVNAGGKTVIKRQTYRKEDNGKISYELSWWESGAWDDRDPDIKLKKVDAKEIPEGDFNAPDFYELPDEITSIPVYHIKNNRVTGQPFGTSDLAGFETLFTGINQTISDEDLTLALQGLGLYWTNSGPPVDENDEETNWKFGPGWVLEIDEGTTFGRVSGVSSVEPSLAHIGKLEQSMREASGVPDIAIGSVDTQVAESGIALAFHMAPILAGNEEKEQEIGGVMDHMLFDLVTMWFPAYEDFETKARAVTTTSDPLPVNRKAVLEEVTAMLATDPPLISAEYARVILQEKLGYDFPQEMANAIVTEAQAIADARAVDPFAARARFEIEREENAGGGA
jgi:hypothetical protein